MTKHTGTIWNNLTVMLDAHVHNHLPPPSSLPNPLIALGGAGDETFECS